MGVILALLLVIVSVGCAQAESRGQCYSPEQMEAEQWLRLHSELMVITVTCRQGSAGENLVPSYTAFTKLNIKTLKHAEAVMMEYYRAQGQDGQAQLDRLRTKLGNEYGQKIADLSAPVFCQLYRDKVLRLCTAESEQVEQEVASLQENTPAYQGMCVQ